MNILEKAFDRIMTNQYQARWWQDRYQLLRDEVSENILNTDYLNKERIK